MHTLEIRRVVARYTLLPSAGADGEKLRLDAAVRRGLETAAEVALAREGIPKDGEICVRSLDVSARVRLGAPDAAIASDWSIAFAKALRNALDRGSEAVHYSSRQAALTDLVTCVARQDLARVWAWRQLGLWRLPEPETLEAAYSESARALLEDSRIIVPVLGAVARHGALGSYVRRLSADQWSRIASAALRLAQTDELGGGGLGAGRDAASLQELSDLGVETLARSVVPAARVRRSRLFLAAEAALTMTGWGRAEGSPSRSAAREERRLVRALAALVALDLEPALAERGSAALASWVLSIEGLLARPTNVGGWVAAPAARMPEEVRRTTARTVGGGEAPASQRPEVVSSKRSSVLEGAARTRRKAAADSVTGDNATREMGLDARGEVVDVRRRGLTRLGGLLFLLNLLEPLEIPRLLATAPLLEQRPLRFCLYGLALSFFPSDAADPALLAFAGLAPDSESPASGQAPPIEAELELFDGLGNEVVTLLQRRLERPEATREEVLAFVCRRRATIIADPGWIEVQLAERDVSVELRRAGLDLDPGWLRWLGVVVTFRYV